MNISIRTKIRIFLCSFLVINAMHSMDISSTLSKQIKHMYGTNAINENNIFELPIVSVQPQIPSLATAMLEITKTANNLAKNPHLQTFIELPQDLQKNIISCFVESDGDKGKYTKAAIAILTHSSFHNSLYRYINMINIYNSVTTRTKINILNRKAIVKTFVNHYQHQPTKEITINNKNPKDYRSECILISGSIAGGTTGSIMSLNIALGTLPLFFKISSILAITGTGSLIGAVTCVSIDHFICQYCTHNY
jgi:hypothetical protein